MRILFALAGLHRVNRGAEMAFTSIGTELANAGHQVTLIGSGPSIDDRPYEYLRAACVPRERFENFPRFPFLRQETAWEELTFIPGLLACYNPSKYDVTLTCGFPFTNFVLRRPAWGASKPKHIFVTQNGDWPAYSRKSEYRLFGCDGLICTNPDYFERNRATYRCALIPNGVDLTRFSPGGPARARFGLEPSQRIVLMVSALIASKHVDVAIDAVSAMQGATLLVAGDGPLRHDLAARAEAKLPGRYQQIHVSPANMPDLYRSADVFLHLSQDESFGNVFVEALVVGLPIVAWDLPRTRWIVGDSPFLATPGDLQDLGRKIGDALKTRVAPVDEAVRSRFSWENVANQYGEFIEDTALNENRPHSI